MSFGYSIGDFITILTIANDLRKRFKDAPAQYKVIVEQVDLLCGVLDQFRQFRDEHLEKQQELVDKIVRSCRTTLEELQAHLERCNFLADDAAQRKREKVRRWWTRLTWDEGEIENYRRRLAFIVDLCDLLLSKLSQDGISAVEQKQHNQEKEKILSWLSTIDPSFQHKQISPTRQEGTGTWLLETSLFQDWIKGHGNVLFCPGIPGAGKTVLSSMVIDHLQHRYASQGSIGITYFFFDYKNQQPTMFEIYSALLRQLIRRQSSLPEGVLSMHKKYVQNGETPSLSQMLRELTTALVACSKAFIVIDALDECPIHDGKRSVRHSVLRDLLSLCEKHQVNLLATSRPDREISACFGTGKSIEIRASLDDIKRYVDMRMGELEALIQRKPDLEHRIGSEIPKAANGMFLLARLYFNLLSAEVNVAGIERLLEKIRTGSPTDAYQSAYNETVDRINRQRPRQLDIAKRTIGWIVHAKRLLTVTELQHAIAVEIESSGFNEANVTYIEKLTSLCCGLIVVDEQTSQVMLVHYTTQKYFEAITSTWFPSFHQIITDTCLTYLSYDVFGEESGRYLSKLDIDKLPGEFPLYPYAATSWGRHFEHNPRSERLALKFLRNKNMVCLSNHSGMFSPWDVGWRFTFEARYLTGLHVVAFFGLRNLLHVLLEPSGHPVDILDRSGHTPLYYAAIRGQAEAAEVLLDKGASPDPIRVERFSPDPLISVKPQTVWAEESRKFFDGKAPLHGAAEAGQETLVELLLKRGANIEARELNGESPLFAAAQTGKESTVQTLLSNGASVESRDVFGLTPLEIAVCESQEEAAKLIMKHGSKDGLMNEFTDGGGAALVYDAAVRGNEELLRLLLQHGATLDPTTCGPQPLPPSSEYVSRRDTHADILGCLELEGNLAIMKRLAFYGQTVFHQAVTHRGESAARMANLFLKLGAKPDVTDRFGRTPLFHAVSSGRISMVKLLLSLPEVNQSPVDVWGFTPAQEARRRGYRAVYQLFKTEHEDDDSFPEPMQSADMIMENTTWCMICFGFIQRHDRYFACGCLGICSFCPPAQSRVCPLCGHRLEEKKYSGDPFGITDVESQFGSIASAMDTL